MRGPSIRLLPGVLILLGLARPGWSADLIQIISHRGGRVDWSRQDLIAFDRRDGNGFYNIYTMKPDGSDVRCLTCERDSFGLPHRNVGQPAWDPSGRYLIFQAEKDRHPPARAFLTSPDLGVYHDLWVLDLTTKKATALTQLPTSKNVGTLLPHFSAGGHRVCWSQMYRGTNLFSGSQQFGFFKLMVADFSTDGGSPRLEHLQDYEPDGEGFYESYGFSPDGLRLIFSHNTSGTSPLKTNIFTMDLETNGTKMLTDGGHNEHAFYSPDGRRILWITNLESAEEETDFWVMNADGSHKARLTCFNQPGCPAYTGEKITASDCAWSPDGKSFVGYVQVGAINNSPDDTKYEARNLVIRVPN